MTASAAAFSYLDNDGLPIAMAHRGGAANPEIAGLENSAAAFGHAVALGYRYLETDVYATRDGTLVSFHDPTLDRVTDAHGAIADVDAATVRAARINGTEPIPLMEELLEAFPDTRFNIDVKHPAAVRPLADLLRRTDALDRVCVSSFSQRRIAWMRRLLGPKLCTGLGPAETAYARLSPLPLSLLISRQARCLQIPVTYGRLRMLTPHLIARAHAAGRQVHVWTVDDPDEMNELLDAGVDGLITDRTDVLRDVLVARGQWA